MANDITHKARLNRLREFYDFHPLMKYKDFCFEHDVDEEDGVKFLYTQTLTEYFVDNPKTPRIERYALRLLMNKSDHKCSDSELEEILEKGEFVTLFNRNRRKDNKDITIIPSPINNPDEFYYIMGMMGMTYEESKEIFYDLTDRKGTMRYNGEEYDIELFPDDDDEDEEEV